MDVFEAIKNRRSVRSYDSRPLGEDVYQRLLEALRFAPSACNYQPWQFILVQEEDLRRQVARGAKNQMWMADAPLIVVACGMPKNAYKYMGGYGNSCQIDIAIALDHLSLVAVSQGLGTCWIGAFDERQIKHLLHIPDDVKPIALMPVGYPQTPDLIHPAGDHDRKKSAEIFSKDSYA